MFNVPSFTTTVLLVTRVGMGNADQNLQLKIFETYFTLLLQNNSLPAAICFYTDGVKLVVEGSPFIDLLKKIQDRGVRLIVCSTCLNYFGLTNKVRVGVVGGLPDIIEAQRRAEKVITI